MAVGLRAVGWVLVPVGLLGCRPDHDPRPAATTPSGTPTAPAPPPTLTGVDPALGDPAGGAWLTVTGTGLADAAVAIGGRACTDPVVTAGAVACRAPALAPGAWDVTATTAAGTATLPAAWEAWSPAAIPGARVYLSTAGLDLGAAPATDWTWDTVAATSPWHPRDGAGLLWLADRLWLLGGWDSQPVAAWNGGLTTNEVWSSADLGATWTLELPDDRGGSRWAPRHTAGWLVHPHDGVDHAWVIGGDLYAPVGDVWRSADGTTWELVLDHAPWEGRVLQMVGAYAGDLYVMGGQVALYDPGTALADVWRSGDGGATWERLPDAPWAPRGMVYNPVEHDGRLWLVGGGTYDDAPRSYFRDVWSFDGTDWTLVNAEAPWTAREYHNVWVADGELWVSSGWGEDQANHNDVWHSPDGITWTELDTPPFQPGHADGLAVTPFGAIHASGNAMDTAVHRLERHTSAPVAAWRDQGAGGLDLAPGPGAEPDLVVGEAGAVDAVWLDGTDDFFAAEAWDAQPDGRSVFWVAATERVLTWWDSVNPSMTVVGDSLGSCRAQAGYSEDGIEYVATDPLGAWRDGHVRAGSGLADGAPRLVGFTHAADGVVTAYVDGRPVGEPQACTYDAPFVGWDLVGAGYATGSRAQARLGVVVVAPVVLDDADLDRLTAFARKWTDPPP